MLTYAHVCSRMPHAAALWDISVDSLRGVTGIRVLTYAGVCWRMQAHAEVCKRMLATWNSGRRRDGERMLTYAAYAGVCRCVLTCAATQLSTVGGDAMVKEWYFDEDEILAAAEEAGECSYPPKPLSHLCTRP
jgi:hypothetical protein